MGSGLHCGIDRFAETLDERFRHLTNGIELPTKGILQSTSDFPYL
jgi:hypothetical protein